MSPPQIRYQVTTSAAASTNASGGVSYTSLDSTVERFLGLLPEYQAQLVSTPAVPVAVAPPVA